MDSGASNMMFVSREMFIEYTLIASQVGDSAKAVDGGFKIVGEGSVIQWYQVDGKECTVTYTRALHTPALNANLISISALIELDSPPHSVMAKELFVRLMELSY